MLQAMLSGFFVLLVTVGPLEAAAIFAGLTANLDPAARRRLALRSTVIATVLLLGFAFGGGALLAFMHIGLPAFRLAGGFLLMLVAVDLLLVHPSGLTSLTSAETAEAGHRDIAVFPLAIPLLAGPGSMAAVVLLMTGAHDPLQAAGMGAVVIAVMAVTLASLLAAGPLTRLLGVTGVNVFARVSGILLAAYAVQMMLDGLAQSGVFKAG